MCRTKLQSGRATVQGTYDELRGAAGDFAVFLEEYMSENKDGDAESEADNPGEVCISLLYPDAVFASHHSSLTIVLRTSCVPFILASSNK